VIVVVVVAVVVQHQHDHKSNSNSSHINEEHTQVCLPHRSLLVGGRHVE
jgi:hypothetical protein